MMELVNNVGQFFSKFPSLWPGTFLATMILAVNGAYNHNTFASYDDVKMVQRSLSVMQTEQRINFVEAEIANIQREIFSLERLNGESTIRDKNRLDELKIQLKRKERKLKTYEH